MMFARSIPEDKFTTTHLMITRDKGGSFWAKPKVNVRLRGRPKTVRFGWRWTAYGIHFFTHPEAQDDDDT